MDVMIHRQFGLLAETISLVCAWISDVDPELLTADAPGCVPVEEVKEMMETVCDGLNREDKKLQLFFHGFPANHPHDSRPHLRCVGSLLVHSCAAEVGHDLEACRKALHDSRLGVGLSMEFTSVSMGLSAVCRDEYLSLAEELKKIDIPEDLRLNLAVVLTAYHQYADWLCDILEPLAMRLEPLLEPWEEKLQSIIIPQWMEALHSEEQRREFVAGRINGGLQNISQLFINPHLLYPRLHSSFFNFGEDSCLYRAGVALPMQKEETDTLPAMDVMVMQLLSNMDRLRMLQAMTGRAMQPKDLARELGINRGKVFRDLNNLINAHLVEPVSCGGRPHVTTNMALVKIVFERVTRFLQQGSKQ